MTDQKITIHTLIQIANEAMLDLFIGNSLEPYYKDPKAKTEKIKKVNSFSPYISTRSTDSIE